MPFNKFPDMEPVSEERLKAIQESVQSMPVAELRKVVKELSEFEGDPWKQKLAEVVETHPEESFYRAVTQEGAIILYCPSENIGVWFLPGSGMGPLPEEGDTPDERSRHSAWFFRKPTKTFMTARSLEQSLLTSRESAASEIGK